jgi:hypothetical protein
VPPNVLAEKLLEYASSTSSIRHSNLPSRPSSLSSHQQQRRSPSKPPIVSDIANLLSVSNNNNKELLFIVIEKLSNNLPMYISLNELKTNFTRIKNEAS